MFRAVKEWKYGDVLVIIQNLNTAAVTATNLGSQQGWGDVTKSYVQVTILISIIVKLANYIFSTYLYQF